MQRHESLRTGVLLVNTGTPDEPTKRAIRPYLARFLSDRRIVDMPRILWYPILYGIILQVRPRKTVAKYQRIWTEEGSPYTLISDKQRIGVLGELALLGMRDVEVIMAHRYGNPSIGDALMRFRELGCERIVLLPLYPQYAYATTTSVEDEFAYQLERLDYFVVTRAVTCYNTNSYYLDALAASIREQFTYIPGVTKLVFSFHSIPLKDIEAGDPYEPQTSATALGMAQRLGLRREDWTICYQSRFTDGQKWLAPFLTDVIDRFADGGVKDVSVVCPGFASDCIETLVDVAEDAANYFYKRSLQNGSQEEELSFRYIPALNARPDHLVALAHIVAECVGDWDQAESLVVRESFTYPSL